MNEQESMTEKQRNSARALRALDAEGVLRPLAAFEHLAPPDTLRRAALEGRLSAQKLGRDWLTTEAALRRYLRSRYHTSKRPFFVKELDTNHCQVDSGWVDYGFDRWVERHGLEIVTRDPLRAIVRAEWGNGEGYDTFAVEFSPEQEDDTSRDELDWEIRLLAARRAELGLEKEAASHARDKVRASARVAAAERRAAQQESDVRDMALSIAGNMHPHPAVIVEFDAEKIPAWRVVIAPDLSEWLTEPLTEPEPSYSGPQRREGNDNNPERP